MISGGVRPSPLAGTWYPGDRETLAGEIDRLLAVSSRPPVAGRLVALVSPHAGCRYSGACAATGYALARGGGWRRVVVLGPSHHVGFDGVALPGHDWWETPLGRVAIDRAGCDTLMAAGVARVIPGADRREHSVEMQVPFLQRSLGEFTLLPLMTGHMEEDDMERLAVALRPFLDGETLLVASSDLTHYGASFDYVPFDREVRLNLGELDQGAIRLIVDRDWRALRNYQRTTGITVCGITPIEVLLRVLPPRTEGELLRYYTSGDLTGDWDHVVSYASIGFLHATTSEVLGPAERRALLAIARRAIEDLVASREGMTEAVPEALRLIRGVFVSLHQGGELRGCIGSIASDRPLCLAVADQARAAAFHDPRFEAVTAGELPGLAIEISVLSPLRAIVSPEGFEPGRHGIVLEKARRRALFLPQVAREQGWDREATLRHLSQKAGLGPDGWREGARLSVFTAEVFSESDPSGAPDADRV